MSNRNKNWILPVMAFFLLLTVSCKKDKDDDILTGKPIELDCNYFSQDRVLKKVDNTTVDYIVSCVMSIKDANIVIEPGVVIEFKEDAGIWLAGNGSLKAVGTAALPITFTGVNKNSGSWKGILINGSSTQNELTHTKIHFAGGNAFNSNGDKGAVIVWASSRLKMTHSKVEHSAAHGLNAIYTKSILTLQANDFKNNQLAPVLIDPPYMGFLDNESSYNGNTQNFISVRMYTGEINDAITIRKLDVPYRVYLHGGVMKYVVIENDVTIEPGVTMEFADGSGLKVNTDGSLKAVGTQTQPIVFTGVNKISGAWIGFDFRHTTSPLNQIAFAKIEYAGNPLQDGAINMWNKPVLNVNNTEFANIANCAFYAGATNPNPNLTHSQLSFENVNGTFCGD